MDKDYLRTLLAHFPVIPLQPGGRAPYLKFFEATRDIDRVAEWEGRWPGMGLAILLEGHTMIDFDRPDIEIGSIPLTWRSNTSRGYHLLYRGETKASTQSLLAKGVDTHSGARQIMPVYPTMHHAGLIQYEWDWDLFGSPIAELPEDIRSRLGEASNGATPYEDCPPARVDSVGRALMWIAEQEPAIEGSEGSVRTFTVACQLRRKFGLNDDQTLLVLANGYNDRCKPPWSDAELRNKVKYSRRAIADYVPELEGLGTKSEAIKMPWDEMIGRIESSSGMFAPRPPIDWICEPLGIARRGAPTLVHGYSHSGKSYAAQAAALALAAGLPIWGKYRVDRPMKVVHVDYEQGRDLSIRRYQKLAIGMGIDLRELGHHLMLVTSPKIYICEEWRDRMFGLLSDIDLVIWDSLHVACRGIEENSADARDYLDILNQLSQLLPKGCQHWLLHHERKSGENNDSTQMMRGSSALADASDNIIRFNPSKDRDGLHKIEHTKNKVNGQTLDDFYLQIKDIPPVLGSGMGFNGGHEGGVVIEVAAAEDIEGARDDRRLRDACEKIVTFLSSGGMARNRDELAYGAQIDKAICSRALSLLEAEGILIRGRRGDAMSLVKASN